MSKGNACTQGNPTRRYRRISSLPGSHLLVILLHLFLICVPVCGWWGISRGVHQQVPGHPHAATTAPTINLKGKKQHKSTWRVSKHLEQVIPQVLVLLYPGVAGVPVTAVAQQHFEDLVDTCNHPMQTRRRKNTGTGSRQNPIELG